MSTNWKDIGKGLMTPPTPEDFRNPSYVKGLVQGFALSQFINKFPQIKDKVTRFTSGVQQVATAAIQPIVNKIKAATMLDAMGAMASAAAGGDFSDLLVKTLGGDPGEDDGGGEERERSSREKVVETD